MTPRCCLLISLLLCVTPSLYAEDRDDMAAEVDLIDELSSQLPQADLKDSQARAKKALLEGDDDGAKLELIHSRLQLIAGGMEAMKFQTRLKELKDLALISNADFEDLSVISAHLYDALQKSKSFQKQAAEVDQVERTLVGFIALESYINTKQLERDVIAYVLVDRVRDSGAKLLAAVQYWDQNRNSASFNLDDLKTSLETLDRVHADIQREWIGIQQRELLRLRTLQLKSALRYDARLPGVNLSQIDAISMDSGFDGVFEKVFSEELRTKNSEGLIFTALQFKTAAKSFETLCRSCKASDVAELSSLSDRMVTSASMAQKTELTVKAQALLNTLTEQDDHTGRELDATVFPQATAEKISSQILYFLRVTQAARQNYSQESSTWQKLKVWERSRSFAAFERIERSLKQLYRDIRKTEELASVETLAKDQATIKISIHYAIEAALNGSTTADEYANLIENVAQNYRNHSSQIVSAQHQQLLRTLLLTERHEETFRAYVNRDTITTSALATLLAAEAISIIYSGGTSAAAIPATSAALKAAMMGGKVAVAIAKTILVADAAVRIIDRTNSQGFVGFASFDTAFDSLVILSILPRMPLPMGTATTKTQQAMQTFQKQLAYFQSGTIRQLSVVSSLFACYQMAYAESISQELAKDGVQLSTHEIRRRAAVNLAISTLAFVGSRRYAESEKLKNPAAYNEMQQKLSLRESFLIQRIKGALNPYRAGMNFYQAHPSMWRAVAGTGIGIGYVAYDYLLINEAILLSYANPDFNYMNQIEQKHPFPELKVGESALALVGLDPLDSFLYMGAHGKGSHRSELKKYGNQYDIDDFISPDDLLIKLQEHAKRNGPIRYLKILTHGRPGQLFTRQAEVSQDAVAGSGSYGWIDATWMRAFKDKIRNVSSEVFAPDARIVLWACLVGSNLDWANEPNGNLKVGDEFLTEFGNAFLVKGGAIDSSTRMLVGLDAVFGNAVRSAANAGFEFDAAQNQRPMVPVIDLENPIDFEDINRPLRTKMPIQDISYLGQGHIYASASEEAAQVRPDNVGPGDSAIYLLNRIQKMLIRMPEVWYKYGVQLEGPWWQNRYKYVEVKPSTDL